VIPLLICHARKEWPEDTVHLTSLLSGPKDDLAGYIPDFGFELYDLQHKLPEIFSLLRTLMEKETGLQHHFYFLLGEGRKRYNHRIHTFCQMRNHVHLVIQVGETPLFQIMQNLSFRYTRHIYQASARLSRFTARHAEN